MKHINPDDSIVTLRAACRYLESQCLNWEDEFRSPVMSAVGIAEVAIAELDVIVKALTELVRSHNASN